VTATERLVAEYETRLGRLSAPGQPKPERITFRITERTREQVREMAEFWGMTKQRAAEELFRVTIEEAWVVFRARREGNG